MKPLRDHAKNLFQNHRTEGISLTALALVAFLLAFFFWIGAYRNTSHELEVTFDAHATPALLLTGNGSEHREIRRFPVSYPNRECDWDVRIEASGEKNPNAWGAQIWVQRIATDKGALPWESVNADSGWELRESKIGAYGKTFACFAEGKKSVIKARAHGSRLCIVYTRHEWSGIMRVTVNGQTQTVDAWRDSFSPGTLEFCAPPDNGDTAGNIHVSTILNSGEISNGLRVATTSGSVELKEVLLDGNSVKWNANGTLRLPSGFRLIFLPSLGVSFAIALAVPLLGILLWNPCRKHPLTAFTLLVILLKLWTCSGDEVVASPYDARGYMISALHGFWGLPLDTHAYDRQPGYPLSIAAGRALGLPLLIWLELLYCSSCVAAASVLPRLKFPRWSYAVALTLMVFNPLTYPVLAFAYQDVIYTPFLIFFIGAALHTLPPGKTRLSAAIATGVAGALVWNTRPEHILLAFLLMLLFVLTGLVAWTEGKKVRDAILHALGIVAPSIVIIAAVTLGFCAASRTSGMGAFAASNYQLPGFTALYDELLAIQPEQPEHHHPIPTDVRMKAYAASPAFAEIRDSLEGPALDEYRQMAESIDNIRNDFGIFVFWGLRAAPWGVKHWQSAAELDRYYARCARELREARKRGDYKSRTVLMHFVDPDSNVWLPYLGDGAAKYWDMLIQANVYGLYPEDPKTDSVYFDQAALRRTALVKANNAIWTTPAPKSIRTAKKISAVINAAATWAAAILLLPMCIILAFRLARERNPETMIECALLIFLVAAFASRFAMLTLMHAVAFEAETRYILPVAPLPALLLSTFPAILVRMWKQRKTSPITIQENPDA